MPDEVTSLVISGVKMLVSNFVARPGKPAEPAKPSAMFVKPAKPDNSGVIEMQAHVWQAAGHVRTADRLTDEAGRAKELANAARELGAAAAASAKAAHSPEALAVAQRIGSIPATDESRLRQSMRDIVAVHDELSGIIVGHVVAVEADKIEVTTTTPVAGEEVSAPAQHDEQPDA